MGASASNTCEYDAFEVPTRIAIDAAIAGVNVLVLLALWCTYTGPCSRAPQTFASQHNNNGGRQGAAGAGYGAGAGVDLWAQKALRKRRGRGRGFMATLCPCFFAGHNYGLPPRDLTQFLASLGFAVSATPVVLFYVLYFLKDRIPMQYDVLCNAQYCNTYVPLLALFFTLFACTLVSSVCFRDRTRQAAVNCIPMQGDEQILMFPVGRGLLATPVAQRMTTGTLWCVDTYGTCYTPESDGWCRYNLEQELVPSRVVEVVSVKSFNRLPFEDGSMDIVTLPFVTTMAYLSYGSEPGVANMHRLKRLLREVRRVLRPGGTVWGLEAFFRVSGILQHVAAAGFELAHQQHGRYFVSSIPQRAWQARRPTRDSGKLGNVLDAEQGVEEAEDSAALLPTAALSEPSRPPTCCSAPHLFVRCLGGLVLVAMGCGLVTVTVHWWAALSVPAELPWMVRIGSQLMQCARVFSVSVYYYSGNTLRFVTQTKRSTCAVLGRVLRICVTTVLALVVFSAITWLPSFGLDELLVHAFHVPVDRMRLPNAAISLVIVLVFVRAIIWAASRRKSPDGERGEGSRGSGRMASRR